MISIITSCIGRELYLKRLIDSIRTNGGWEHVEFEHLIVFQAQPPSERLKEYLNAQPFAAKLRLGTTGKVETMGKILNDAIHKAKYPIIFKIDDDCTLLSPDFLLRVYELTLKLPTAAFYPAIVDGEIPLTGGANHLRQCVYLEKSNTYVTIGDYIAASGKYILPKSLAEQIHFTERADAIQVAAHCLQLHLPVFQAVNGIIIDNQDGFSGQQHRKKNPNGQQW